MNKIKVLLIGMTVNIGGIETFLLNLVKKADRNVFSFDFLYMGEEKMAYEEEILPLGCKIINITPRKKSLINHYKELNRIISNYDIIHINVMKLDWWCEPILVSSLKKVKTIVHSHSTGVIGDPHSKLFCFLQRSLIVNINYHRLACSKSAGEYMFKGKPFVTVYNGISYEKFIYDEKSRQEIRKELKISDDEFVLGSVAVFLPFKNHVYMIDVFNEYHKLNPKTKLILVGAGDTIPATKEKINKYSLQDNVIFTGKRNDVNKIYSALDGYINTSLLEGFAISIVEAQINGLRCYVSEGSSDEIDISNNVKFMLLKDGPQKWASTIFNDGRTRKNDIVSNISHEYDNNYSYNKVYDYYKTILNEK